MPPLRTLLLALACLAGVLPGAAGAAPLRADRGGEIDWRIPGGHVLSVFHTGPKRALSRVRLVTAEVVILPSGRMVTRSVAMLPARPEPPRRPDADLIVLPLPAAMPLFLAALAGLLIAGRRRRGPSPTARAELPLSPGSWQATRRCPRPPPW
jgi:hypothetical protein